MPTIEPSPTRLPAADTARLRAALWRYLRVLGASASDADDLAQEAFMVALRRPDFEAGSAAAVFTFLRTTARHLWLRSRHRHIDERQIAEADAIWDRRCGSDGSGDDYLEALRACVDALPARSRQLLQATYGEGEGRQRAGTRLGIGSHGVKSALRRLRAALHDCIQRRLARQR
ncbi:MAG: sigma-70 family RNA polymerase sigma factor [Planctomycetes bacterium]|nr:sigma-70 family RNA polymerase sigma factor [Planctomycetota bacterium]